MYEHRSAPLVSREQFIVRMVGHTAAALLLLALSLGLGMWGYTRFESLPWREAFLNAAMLLGGMGPVDTPRTDAGRLFAGGYALYAGLVFIVTATLLLAPLLHRLLHRFHWPDE